VVYDGEYASIAPKVLMKILYAARMARFDLLKAVNSLSCFVTKWSKLCDHKLHRLVCYINSTILLQQVGWVGDRISE
jgi:hypothetical protein